VTLDGAAVRPPDALVAPSSEQTDAGRSRGSLIVAWQHPASRLIEPVGLLEHGLAAGYRFRYLRRAADVPDFQPFLSFPDLDRTYTSTRLFPLFSQRIMSPRRPDYGHFLRQLHLHEDASPWEQLARSEGRRTGDTVQVFPIPIVMADGTTTCQFLVHGIRHVTGGALPPLRRGEVLDLRDDPSNPVNPNAVLVCTRDGTPLGYVPDLLLEHLRAVQSAGPPRLVVEHTNGLEAPAHLRLLVRLEGRTPPGYTPMSGPRWQTYDNHGLVD
jgi:hypothetical protein